MTKPKPPQKLVCAHGSPWKSDPWGCGPCLKCQAYSAELSAAFERAVFFGEFDARGYTPADRRAEAKAAQVPKGEAA